MMQLGLGGGGRGGSGRGGSGRGAGRKSSKNNGLGAGTPTGTQVDLASLLGAKRSPDEMQPQAEPTGELVKWKYNRHDGGSEDTLVDQEQRVGGKVVYKLFATGRPATLLAKGTEEDKYWVDDEDTETEVPQEHERARERNRGGELQIKLDGDDEPTWVTASHVRAVTAPAGAATRSPLLQPSSYTGLQP